MQPFGQRAEPAPTARCAPIAGSARARSGRADTSPATPATVLPCAESKALRSTAHAYRPAADPARQSASPLGKPQQRLQHRPLSIRHLARCVHLCFADSPKPLPLCRPRAGNTRENCHQVFIGQVLVMPLERARRVHARQRYDRNKVYSVHEPEVECIAKLGPRRQVFVRGVARARRATLMNSAAKRAWQLPAGADGRPAWASA